MSLEDEVEEEMENGISIKCFSLDDDKEADQLEDLLKDRDINFRRSGRLICYIK